MLKLIAQKSAQYFGISLAGFVITTLIIRYGPIYRLEYQRRIQNNWLKSAQAAETKEAPMLQDNSTGAIIEEAASWQVNSTFSIVIPKLNLSANVLSNIDPFNEQQYSAALQKGIAHAKGTSFPGFPGTTYLFAHSTDSSLNVARYNALFYQLRDLEENDKIIIFFQDKKLTYQVTEKHIVSASDTSWLNRHSDERLILQTCDPPGTTWRRLLVIAKPIS